MVARERLSSAPVAWTLAAGLAGLASSALFSSLLHLPRPAFVAVHTLVTLGFVGAYVTLTRTDPAGEARRRWASGLAFGILCGLALIRGVTLHPAASVASGGALLTGLVWFGLVYGLMDALLLNVIPAHAFLRSCSGSRRAPWKVSALALAASLLVTALYHLGFSEFRGSALLQPLIQTRS
jgi:hypothetical protein